MNNMNAASTNAVIEENRETIDKSTDTSDLIVNDSFL